MNYNVRTKQGQRMSKSENSLLATIQSTHNVEQLELHRTKDQPQGLILGLDILEYLARYRCPIALTELADQLNTSLTALYRSIRLLEERGYVAKGDDRGVYGPTPRLYDLEMATPANRRLLVQAQPIMQALCDDIHQSCNLSVPNPAYMTVIAATPSPGPIGIHIPLGYRYNIAGSAAGLAYTLFGAAPARRRRATDMETLRREAVDRGYVSAENPCLPDVTDLCCAILENHRFVAALSIPYIKALKGPNRAWCLAGLQRAAEQLSQALSAGTMVA